MVKCAYLLNRLTLVFLLLFVSGCVTGQVVNEVTVVAREDNGKILDVVFCPREDCSGKISEFILEAEEKVHCAFYDLDLEDVKAALEEQSKNIEVKLIVDTDNFEYVEEFDFVKQDNRSSIMHNKFCIVDGKKIFSGSMNPTVNGNDKNNNNLIFIESAALADNYEDEFDEMWNGIFGKGEKTNVNIVYLNNTKVKNYFCPEDKCGDRIEEELKEAEESIHFMLFSFTHTGVANKMVMMMNKSVEVNGIFEKRGAGTKYSRYKLLDFQGADVRKDNNSAVMHHKVFIIDNKTVITGSFNPSNNADKRNDENILVVHDEEIAAKYLKEFEFIWSNYTENEKE